MVVFINNSDIDLIRKKYNSLILEKRRIQNVRNKILELENDPKVKEYLGLEELVKNYDNINSEEKFYDDVGVTIKETEDSNKILFSYGCCSMHIRNSFKKMKLYVYRDLETKKFYYLTNTNNIEPIPFCFDFMPIDYLEQQKFLQKNEKFSDLRRYFIEQIINRPQEEVVEELLESNKQLVKLK